MKRIDLTSRVDTNHPSKAFKLFTAKVIQPLVTHCMKTWKLNTQQKSLRTRFQIFDPLTPLGRRALKRLPWNYNCLTRVNFLHQSVPKILRLLGVFKVHFYKQCEKVYLAGFDSKVHFAINTTWLKISQVHRFLVIKEM